MLFRSVHSRISLAILLITSGACTSEDAVCIDGFELGDDGLCYQVDDSDDLEDGATPTTYGEFLSAIAPCTTEQTGDGELDLYAACIGDACIDEAIEDWVAAHGEGDCIAIEDSPNTECTWLGFGVEFADDDADGEPNVGALAEVFVTSGLFSGATTDGLTTGIPLSCFTDVFGDPSFYFGGDSGFQSLSFFSPFIGVSSFDSSGLTTEITVYGQTDGTPNR